MQFKVVLSALSFALAASAVPTGSPPPTCSQNQTTACCSGKNLLGQLIGCVAVDLVTANCNAGQSQACCSNFQQTGLVNLGCTPINVVL